MIASISYLFDNPHQPEHSLMFLLASSISYTSCRRNAAVIGCSYYSNRILYSVNRISDTFVAVAVVVVAAVAGVFLLFDLAVDVAGFVVVGSLSYSYHAYLVAPWSLSYMQKMGSGYAVCNVSKGNHKTMGVCVVLLAFML